jgi:hypothetical protein
VQTAYLAHNGEVEDAARSISRLHIELKGMSAAELAEIRRICGACFIDLAMPGGTDPESLVGPPCGTAAALPAMPVRVDKLKGHSVRDGEP